MHRPNLSIVTRVHNPKDKEPVIKNLKTHLLVRETYQWLDTLTKIGNATNIPCSGALNTEDEPLKYADLLVDAHYALEPLSLSKIPDLSRERRFGIYLILSREEIPIADWKNGMSHPLVHSKKNENGLLVPEASSLHSAALRVRCQSMSSFSTKEMQFLLRDVMSFAARN